MGVARRVAELYQMKVNALLDRVEDPRQTLDYSYTQQQEFLRRMQAAVADVAASRRRAQMQESELRRTADRLRSQAEQAVAAGKEDLGREALRLRAETAAHADDVAEEQAGLRVEEERLSEAARRLEARIEAFGYRKEALKAAYTAARAAALGTPLEGADDVTEAARRAEDQTAALQARAEALGQQIRTGRAQTIPLRDADRIQEQLDAITREAAVEEDLARIRERLASTPADNHPRREGPGNHA
jgi:phage shock protein A